jgi:hypothetical protein
VESRIHNICSVECVLRWAVESVIEFEAVNEEYCDFCACVRMITVDNIQQAEKIISDASFTVCCGCRRNSK